MSSDLTFAVKPVIACIHLLATPGAPGFDGSISRIYDTALMEAEILVRHGVNALIIENFRDRPFYPDAVPAITTATIAGVAKEIGRITEVPLGIAVLRNDAHAAMSIATAIGAHFIRVNVHVGAVLSAQGIVVGSAHATLRLRDALRSEVKVFADVRVKHSTPLAYRRLADEVCDAAGCSDAVIVSGAFTGIQTEMRDVKIAKKATMKPVLIGSGVSVANIEDAFDSADGFIVGSDLKAAGLAENLVDEGRVRAFMARITELREKAKLADRSPVIA